MQAQHTKGPWAARKGTTTGAEVVGFKSRGGEYVIARCGGKDREANAQMMAAAPDLLEAVRALYDELERNHYGAGYEPNAGEPMGIAKAAIAKAMGHNASIAAHCDP